MAGTSGGKGSSPVPTQAEAAHNTAAAFGLTMQSLSYLAASLQSV